MGEVRIKVGELLLARCSWNALVGYLEAFGRPFIRCLGGSAWSLNESSISEGVKS